MDKLEILREQLNTALDFMENTPRQDGYMWEEEMPAYPDEYDPDEWVEGGQNRSINLAWVSFLDELTGYEMHDRRKEAEALEIADLLNEGEDDE